MGKRAPIFQLKITLNEVVSPIWRRVLVPSTYSLRALHIIFQAVMGWEDYHLHLFEVGHATFAEPSPDWDDLDIRDERWQRLSTIAPGPGSVFVYCYDLGDGWHHDVEVERTTERQPGISYPIRIDGQRACPPEDCGGVGGCARYLAAIADPEHEEHDEYVAWRGPGFDAEAFSLAAVNQRLSEDMARRRRYWA